MRYFIEWYKTEIIAILSFFILVAIGLYIGFRMDKISCYKTAKTLNYKCEYSIWTGCILTDENNKKFLLEQLRQVKD